MIIPAGITPDGSYMGLEDFRIASKTWGGWEFWGFKCGGCSCSGSSHSCNSCNKVLFEYHYQKNRLSRDDIRMAICAAEQKALQVLKIPVGRRWQEEVVRLPVSFKHRQIAHVAQDCRWPAVQLCLNKVRALGVPQYTKLNDDIVPVLYRTTNEGIAFQPLDDPATPYSFFTVFPLPDPTISVEDIQVHIHASYIIDGSPVPSNDTWIRPVEVSIEDGMIIVRGRAWMMGDPRYWEQGNCSPRDCTDIDEFMTGIDLYTLTTNTEGTTVEDAGIVLLSENPPCGCGCCVADVGTDPATMSKVVTRGGVRLYDTGMAYIGRATYDEDTQEWREDCCSCSNAQRALVRFEAGMTEACTGDYLKTISKLAAGCLPEICPNCCNDYTYLKHWAQDLTKRDNGEETNAITYKMISNPYGTTRGIIYGIKELYRHRVQRALVL